MAWTKYEKWMLKAMYQEHRPMSVREISQKAHISWITADKYIPELLKKGIIKKYTNKKRDYFEFDYEKYQEALDES
jgi:predicted transcriptional regulator